MHTFAFIETQFNQMTDLHFKNVYVILKLSRPEEEMNNLIYLPV